mmetsp:Transcript_91905/g.297256  ORF Transcript_91905/g.297256 Transcript_91905/m.297256 type:complete len:324 (-) Transcript_91905:30-1001(-)
MLNVAAETEGACCGQLGGATSGRGEEGRVEGGDLIPRLGSEDVEQRRDERERVPSLPLPWLLGEGDHAAARRIDLAHATLRRYVRLALAVIQQKRATLDLFEVQDPFEVEILEEKGVASKDNQVSAIQIAHGLLRPPDAQLHVSQHAAAAARGRGAAVHHPAHGQAPCSRPALEVLVLDGVAYDEDLGDGAVLREVVPPVVEHGFSGYRQQSLRHTRQAPQRLRAQRGGLLSARGGRRAPALPTYDRLTQSSGHNGGTQGEGSGDVGDIVVGGGVGQSLQVPLKLREASCQHDAHGTSLRLALPPRARARLGREGSRGHRGNR